MAINNAQLIISPVIRQYFIDPTTLLPVVGQIQFFKIDKITPKNVFQQTGDPQDPFEIATNPIILDTAGAIPFVLYLYPFDETDEDVEELYYVEVRRVDTSLVFALDNFPENFVSGSDGDLVIDDLINKCPSYGFDNPILGNTYTLINQNQLPVEWSSDLSNGARPAQGWTWQLSDLSASQFYYNVTDIAAGALPGNPLYLLTLFSGNIINVQTINNLAYRLCSGNELDGITVNYQLFIQDNIGDVISLDVFVLNADDLTDLTNEVNVGSFTIDTNLTLRTLSFTMPDLSLVLLESNTPTWLYVKLPLNQQFSLSWTGTYTYFGDNLAINRLPLTQGLGQARQLFSENAPDLYDSDNSYLASDLPLTLRKGRTDYLQKTGQLFIAHVSDYNSDFDNSILLNDTTLVRGFNILNTLGDRYLDAAPNLVLLAGNTFVVEHVENTAVFDIQTKDNAASFIGTWTSSNPAAITILQNSNSNTYLSATSLAGVVTVTYKNDFDANSESNFTERSESGKNYGVAQGGTFPSSNFRSMAGAWAATVGGGGVQGGKWGVTSFTPNSFIQVTDTQTGSGSQPAIADIEFLQGYSTASDLFTNFDSFNGTVDGQDSGITLWTNYFTFNAMTRAQDPGGGFTLPGYVFILTVDGVYNISSGLRFGGSQKTYTIDFDSTLFSDVTYLATTLAEGINDGANFTITVTGAPNPTNGDFLDIATSNREIVIVMNDTDVGIKVTPPIPGVATLYVDFVQTDSAADIAQSIINIITENIGGIPTETDLELTPPANFSYYTYL